MGMDIFSATGVVGFPRALSIVNLDADVLPVVVGDEAPLWGRGGCSGTVAARRVDVAVGVVARLLPHGDGDEAVALDIDLALVVVVVVVVLGAAPATRLAPLAVVAAVVVVGIYVDGDDVDGLGLGFGLREAGGGRRRRRRLLDDGRLGGRGGRRDDSSDASADRGDVWFRVAQVEALLGAGASPGIRWREGAG